MPTPRSSMLRVRSFGFSVVEVMVAMALSLILLSGVVTLFASSRKSYESNDHLARIQENGRFALDQITREVRSAGYLGCAKETPFTNALTTTTNTLLWDFQFAVSGFQSTGTAWSPALDTTLVPSAAAVNSDVLVIRAPDPDAQAKRVTTLMGSTSADLTVAPATPAYGESDTLIVTDCNAASVFEVRGYNAGVISHGTGSTTVAALGGVASAGNASANLGYAYPEGSTVLPVRTVIYYVRASSDATKGNSLWRRIGRNVPEELVEGVDSLQVEFGVDTDGDRLLDNYATANNVTDWSSIISVRVGLLLRAVEPYGTYPNRAHNVLGETIASVNDNRERLAFSTTIALRNKAL